MIERARRSRARRGALPLRAARRSLPRRRVRRATASSRSIEDIAHADVWINGGFFVFRREIFDYIRPGEELVEEPFARLIEQASCSPTATTASGRRWTRSRTSSGSTRSPSAAGRRGAASDARAERRELHARCSTLALDGDAPLRRVLALGCHADDIEIGCGGDAPRLTRAAPGARGRLGRARADGGARRRGARERRGVPRRRRRRAVVRPRLPRRLPPLRRRRGQGVLRGAEGAVEPDLDLHARARRPPPGPPARLRADLEHVPRPPDPRVRDPEVRRRPRRAERLRPVSSRRSSTREGSSCSPTHLRASAEALVRRGALPRPDAACAEWSRSPAVRGGVHVPQATRSSLA